MEIAGVPIRFAGTVSRSHIYISNGFFNFSPNLNGRIGMVGLAKISNFLNAPWKDSAFIHCGDDWNGYVLISLPAYFETFEYLNRHDYTTYTTIGTGDTVNQVTKYFESSNLIFVLAHGNERGFHMIDGYQAANVCLKNLGHYLHQTFVCGNSKFVCQKGRK